MGTPEQVTILERFHRQLSPSSPEALFNLTKGIERETAIYQNSQPSTLHTWGQLGLFNVKLQLAIPSKLASLATYLVAAMEEVIL